jgi:hypothetical protein
VMELVSRLEQTRPGRHQSLSAPPASRWEWSGKGMVE